MQSLEGLQGTRTAGHGVWADLHLLFPQIPLSFSRFQGPPLS